MVDTGTKSGKAAFTAALAATAVGGAVLAGWMLDLEALKRLIPGLIAMNPATAVAFILAGISLALFLRVSRGGDRTSRALLLIARLSALAVTLIGVARLAAILSDWDPGVDQWLFASKLANGLEPANRMAPNTALNFLLLGSALLLVDVKSQFVRRGVEFAAVVVSMISLLAILGYAFNIQPFYRLGLFSPMALHTAITFSILSVGFLLAHTDHGLLATIAGNSSGGRMARRLLPVAVLAPALLGWFAQLGENAGVSVAFCDAAETVGNIVVFTVLICWTAQRLFNAGVRRSAAEEATRESEKRFIVAFEHAPIGVAFLSPGAKWLKVNRAFCDMVGYSEADLLTRTCHDITHPDDVPNCVRNLHDLVIGNTRIYQSEKRYVHASGRPVTVSFNVSLVRDGRGQPSYLIAQIQDITDREQAEVVLLESKRFLQAALDALSSHTAILDEHGMILEVNAAWARYARENGFKGSDHGVGDNYLEVCEAAAARRSEDASEVAVGIRDVIAGKSEEFQLEYPCHSPLEQSWFLVRVTRFGGDGPVRVVVAHENITRRKQAELARNDSQLRYRSLFENMLEGYTYCQLLYEQDRATDYVYLEVNSAFAPLTGLKDVVGKKVSEVVPGMHESNPEQLEIYSRVAETGIPEKFESYAEKLDIWFSVSVYSRKKGHFVAVFDNITERKRAETRLRFDEQRYRSLVEATTAIVWDTPASGEFVAEQPGWTALTGQSFEELRGWGWLNAIHPDDQAETGRVWSAAVANRSIYEVEHRLRTRDGTYRHMMVRAVPILAEDETIHQWIGIHTDITERKQAEAWRMQLAAIIESSEDAIVSKDLESNVTSWNAAAERVFGYSAGEMLGLSIRCLIPPDRQEEEDRIMASIRRGESVLQFETDRLTKAGTTIHVSVTVSPIRDASGKVVGASKIARDITEHKRVEVALQESEERYRALIEWSPEPIVVQRDGILLFVNPATVKMLGASSALDLVGRPSLDFVHPDSRHEFLKRRKILPTNKGDHLPMTEQKLVRLDGRMIDVETQGIVIVYDGEMAVYGSVRDITERKRAEAELRWKTAFLEAQVGSSPDGVLVVDKQGKKLLQNQRMIDLLKVPRHIADDPDDEKQVAWAVGMVKDPGPFAAKIAYLFSHPTETSQDQIELTDGTFLDRYSAPVVGSDGTYFGRVWTFRDITERTRSEAELRWKTAFLEAQVNSSLDGVLVADGQGKKLLQNQRLVDLLKIPQHISDDPDDEIQRLWIMGRTKDPAASVVKVAYLKAHPDETSREETELTDGTVLDCYSAPVVGPDGTYFGRIWTFRDITERKRAEESLRLLSSAVEQSRESIMITETDLDLPGPRIVFVNPAFTQMSGYTAEEVIGKTPRMFQGPQTDRKVLDRLRRNLAAGEVFEGETINYRKDGSPFVLAWQVAPIREANGPITHFVAIQRDITERRQSEALLLESQQRLALATDAAHIGIWDWNIAENTMVWDAQMLALYGLRPQDFTDAFEAGQKGLHPEDRERAEAEVAAALAGPQDYRSEFRVVSPSGEVREIQAHGMVHRASDGSPARMIGANWDVTERKRTESRFRRLVDSNVQGIFFWTATGGITGTNDAFLSLTGYSREDLEAGRIDWVALTPPEYAENDRRVLAEIAATGSCLPYEKEFVRKDGTRVPILLGAAAFEDNPEAGVCFVLDLTDRKRLETQLVQSQKMETVGKLAGGIAHEFNSILTAIIGQSELLLADLPAGSPLVSNATEITKAAGRAAALTRQMLAYGRKQLLRPEVLDLNRVITRMEGVLRHLMGVEIDTRIVTTPGLQAVKADAGQLEQVIMQMALNARDAMPTGGKFTVETANVSFDQASVANYPELKPGDYVMLAITDTGQGMTAEVQARAFEPFFSTKGVGEGTGLGLSTCYGIIKQSGGHISVYSELGRGATFKVYLPQLEKPAAAVSQRRPAPKDLPRGTETILLVEDDPALREMAASLLGRLGYTVLAAANGIEALSLKQRPGTGHVDLLFTDMVMPHMSGKELADRVRALYPRTKVLFTSAYTENAMAHQDVLDKGVALLQKPFMPSALAHKLREVLDQPND